MGKKSHMLDGGDKSKARGRRRSKAWVSNTRQAFWQVLHRLYVALMRHLLADSQRRFKDGTLHALRDITLNGGFLEAVTPKS